MRKSLSDFVAGRLADTPTYRVAYADPPYVGMAKRHYGNEPDFAGEVDHEELILSLSEYDGWALSATSTSLRYLLPMCPEDVRVMAWVKTFCAYKSARVAYSWEPVIVKELPRTKGQHPTRDFVPERIAMQKGLIGAKPERFCYWLFNVIGLRPVDDFVDLFPGTNGVSEAWQKWCSHGGPKIKHKIETTTSLEVVTSWQKKSKSMERA